jgi:hypothetical protein
VKSFVALFDILGFSELVRKEELKRVLNAYVGIRAELSAMKRHLNALLDTKAITHQLFSDTFLIYSNGVSDESFTALLAMCNALFRSSIKHGLSIRGSITVGDLMISGRAVIGKPIVEAHKQEGLQDWLGCKLTNKCIKEISKKRFDEFIKDCTIFKYEIPLKSGKVHKQYAFNWIAPIEYACRCKNRGKPVTREQLIKVTSFLDKNPDTWEVRRKVSNTKQFREHAIDVTLHQPALARSPSTADSQEFT